MKDQLITIYNALDQLEVKGRGNVSIVAGCLNVLDDMIKEIEMEEKEDNHKKEK